MEISGKITHVLPTETGQGSKGAWFKQPFVIETDGQYPKSVAFERWGENIEKYPISVGQSVKVEFDIESREYNSRWYTSCKAWKINQLGSIEQANQDGLPPLPQREENDLGF